MFLIHSELYFAYILFGLTKYKKVCFLNFGFKIFSWSNKIFIRLFFKKISNMAWLREDFTIE